MPLALAVEMVLTAVGLALFVEGSALGRGRTVGVAVVTALVTALTVAGGTVAPAPPGARPMAASSLAANLVLVAVCLRLGRCAGRPE